MEEKEREKGAVKIIFSYAKKYFPYVIASLAAVIAVSLCEIFRADLLRGIIDEAQQGRLDAVLKLFLAGAAVWAAAVAAVYINRRFSGSFAALVLRDIKRDSMKHIASLPADYMSSNRTGELLSKMSTDAEVVQSFMESGFVSLMQLPFTVVFFAVYLIRLNTPLFLACFIPVPVLALIGASFATPFKKGSKKYMSYLGRVNNIVQDMASGISVVKAYTLEKTLGDKYSAGIKKATDMAVHNDKYQYKGSFVFSMIRNLNQIICLVLGARMCLDGYMTIGILISFSTLLSKLTAPFISASSLFFAAKSAAASAERLVSVLQTKPEKTGEYRIGEDCENVIEFDDVHFAYEEGAQVLKGLSFCAKKGEETAFAGFSGCGKSTVFSLICGFYRGYSGTIRFMGRDINEWDIDQMRGLISYVSQNPFLFPVSIYENIAMGKKGASEAEVYEAAKMANAHEFILEMPDGYNTVVGERGCMLSGGQVQRIAIARAILKNAPVLLLDEATAALDIKSEYLVSEAVNNLSRDKTILVIAHRLSSIRGADKIMVIDNGTLFEEGSHEELLKKVGIYHKLCAVQTEENR